MIKIWIVHFEWHRRSSGSNCRFPRLYIYRKPRHGDRVMDGGVMGTLIACQACSGVGLLHQADEFKLPEGMPFPMPSLYPEQTCTCKRVESTDFTPEVRKNLWIRTGCPIHDDGLEPSYYEQKRDW